MAKIVTSISFILFSYLIILGQEKELTNELIFTSPDLDVKKVSGFISLDNGEEYGILEKGKNGSEINIYDYKKGDFQYALVNSAQVFGNKHQKIDSYVLNEKQKKVIVKTATEKVYRNSDLAHYFIYDLDKNSTTMVSDTSLGKVSLGFISPNGKYFGFVRANNLFYIELDGLKEVQVSFDGKVNEIINGATDWLYEEEFQNHVGYYWSPDGDKIAYYRFDETAVKTFMLTTYGDLYPENTFYKYPKAGEVVSKVHVIVYNTETKEEHTLNTNYEEYIPRIRWTKSNDHLVIMRLNRVQNHLEFISFNVNEKEDSGIVFYEEESTTYLKVNDNLIFLEDKKHFIWNSRKDGFNHIYLYSLDGELIKQLTSGSGEVDKLYGVDQKNARVYYSAIEKEIQNTALYSVDLNGKNTNRLSKEEGDNSAEFNSDFSSYIHRYSNAETPPVQTLRDANGKEIRVLEDNAELVLELKKYTLPKKEFSYIKTSRGDSLLSYTIYPSDFDSSKSYPFLLWIYGGPGSFKAKNTWTDEGFLWQAMMANKGIIIVSVEPRGTGRRGKEWQDLTYMKLGELETEDFISSSKHFGALPYAEKDKMFVMGKSYGGYMALNCILNASDYFNAAVSIAPVTNWKYYDAVYPERYLRTPNENPKGYNSYNPINDVDKLEDPLLVIHGDRDDNVHVQNTMDFINAAVKADKHFELFIYPNENHAINKNSNKKHVFEEVSIFLLEQVK